MLTRTLFKTCDYLIDHYYPGTSIDTEIIVKSVAKEV